MRIVWDELKRLKNLRERDLDFAWLEADFFAEATVVPTRLGRYKGHRLV
jgi:uncharacterized DUF497 family protein